MRFSNKIKRDIDSSSSSSSTDDWDEDLDKHLIRVLLRARRQKGNFSGMTWSEQRLWDEVTVQVNELHGEAGPARVPAELQDRYEKLRKANKSAPESWPLKGLMNRLLIATLGPVTIPTGGGSSQSRETSQSAGETSGSRLSGGPLAHAVVMNDDNNVIQTFLDNLRALSLSAEEFVRFASTTSMHNMRIFNSMEADERRNYLDLHR